MSDNIYNLTRWAPNFQRGKHFSMSIFAERNGGKSTFLKDIFVKNDFANKFDLFVVFSNSQANAISDTFFRDFVPGNLHFWDFEPDVAEGLFRLQRDRIVSGRKMLDILVIFDDCVSDQQKYNKTIMQFYTRGRNSNISIIFTTQEPSLMRKTWRNNTDYAVLMRTKNEDDRELLIRNYLTCIYSYEDAKKIWFAYVHNYQSLVVVFNVPDPELYVYKAEPGT